MNKQMTDLKITIDQLKNYLGTNLSLEYQGYGEDRTEVIANWTISRLEYHDINFDIGFGSEDDVLFYFKPICYRLSDLDKEIKVGGDRFVPISRLPYGNGLFFYDPIHPESDLAIITETENYSHEIDLYNGFIIMQKLFEWHFWPFGDEYFEQGLVIDKMK